MDGLQNSHLYPSAVITQTQTETGFGLEDTKEHTENQENEKPMDIRQFLNAGEASETGKKFFPIFEIGRSPACSFCTNQPCTALVLKSIISEYVEEATYQLRGEPKNTQRKFVYQNLARYRVFFW